MTSIRVASVSSPISVEPPSSAATLVSPTMSPATPVRWLPFGHVMRPSPARWMPVRAAS
jgi:hypothetical protein